MNTPVLNGVRMTDFIDALTEAGCPPLHGSDIYPGMESELIAQSGDKPSRKTLYVSLSQDGSYGRWYNCKTGDSGYWKNQTEGTTRVDRAERKRLEAEARRKHQEERKKAAKQAAIDAQERWIFSEEEDGSHPYLKKKKIGAYGVARAEDDLLIPMRHAIGGDLIGIQSITPDGDKYFGKGVAKKGAFHLVGNLTPGCTVIVCEGYATGASLYEALDAPVAVAFDAGNLKPVAEYFHASGYVVVIGADNDHNKPENAGVKYGQQAALAVNGACVYPEGIEGTDWNDYACERGVDDIKEIFKDRLAPTQARGTPGEVVQYPAVDLQLSGGSSGEETSQVPGWTNLLIPKGYDKDGNIILDPRSMHNGIVLLKNVPSLKGVFRFNEFKSDVFVCRCPPWDKMDDFTVRRMENVDLTRLEAYLEVSDGMRLGSEKLNRCVEDVAMQDKFHPVRDYFNALEWDGVERLKTHAQRLLKANQEPQEYLAKILTIWFVAGVARVFEPGCKVDSMLVLEGPQDFGKSLWLRTIGTFGRDIEECYYTDAITIDMIEDRGSILKLQGNLIIEFPELSGMGKKDQDQIKRWITLQMDEVEVKYRQRTNVLPRQFILAGTYNPLQGEGWLSDPTGGRRFWPITVGQGSLDVEAVRAEREQLWAEAVALYKQGHQLYIDKSDPVYAMAQAAQADRASVDIWFDPISKIIGEKKYWETSEILEQIGLPVAKQGKYEKGRVVRVMSQLGWKYTARVLGGRRFRCWSMPETKTLLDDVEEVKW